MSSKENYEGIVPCKKCDSWNTVAIRKKDFENVVKLAKKMKKAGSGEVPATDLDRLRLAVASVVSGMSVAGAAVSVPSIAELLSIGVATASLITSFLQLQAAKANGVELIVICNNCGHWEKI
jgi:hypothetical protein